MVEHLPSLIAPGPAGFLAAASPQGGQPSPIFLLLILFGIFWFLLIAPARKRQKERDKMLSQLEKGAEVVTNGGIHGTVAAVEDQVVILKIADQVKIKIEKSAISGPAPRPDAKNER